MRATPNDIIARIERYSGVQVAEAFAIPDLDRESQVALQVCPPERNPCFTDLHGRRPGAVRHQQR